jgi:hypothetical protein
MYSYRTRLGANLARAGGVSIRKLAAAAGLPPARVDQITAAADLDGAATDTPGQARQAAEGLKGAAELLKGIAARAARPAGNRISR